MSSQSLFKYTQKLIISYKKFETLVGEIKRQSISWLNLKEQLIKMMNYLKTFIKKMFNVEVVLFFSVVSSIMQWRIYFITRIVWFVRWNFRVGANNYIGILIAFDSVSTSWDSYGNGHRFFFFFFYSFSFFILLCLLIFYLSSLSNFLEWFLILFRK